MPPARGQSNRDCPRCRELKTALDQQIAINSELRSRMGALEQRLEQIEQEAHRQAAPFRKPEAKRKDKKDKPGRKKGHPPSYRPPPPTADEHVEVPLPQCPNCQGPLTKLRPIEQTVEDIPRVVVRRLHLTTYRGHCAHCGTVCSTHPEQVSTATGAASTHLGRNALALAADLNKHFGLPMRKTCAILHEHFGLRVSPGGLSQALDRIADKLQVPFAEIVQALRRSRAVHADETGWWLGGESAWLWTFATALCTLYTIGDRSQKVIRRILGDDFLGVLVSDCLASYDPHPGPKSKCCAHHLKAISEALEQAPGSEYLANLRTFLKVAMLLCEVRAELDPAEYWPMVARLNRRADELLAAAHSHPAEIRIGNRLRKHREHLLTFLDLEGVDPTNNLAERQLRPAVIARKLSAGNKTERGKTTYETLTSLAVTCRQQGRSFTALVAAWLSLGLPPPGSLFAPD